MSFIGIFDITAAFVLNVIPHNALDHLTEGA